MIRVKREWCGEARCDNCGRTLKFGVNDIRGELVINSNPTLLDLQVSEYSIKCRCKQEIILHNTAEGITSLPVRVCERVNQKFGIDFNKIHRLAMR